jgi:hypothetical protein
MHAFVTASSSAAEPSAGDAALFDRLDANHDNSLVAVEIQAGNERLFARLLSRADSNHDKALSRDEFIAGLVPSRPEKPIEEKQPTELPQANAVKYLLVTMDANRNSMIEANEVPEDLLPVFEALAERLDRNNNDRLERQELDRGGPPLSAIAGRWAERAGIDAAAELKKLEKKEGQIVDRFERPPVPFERIRDPEQARQIFAQLDGNNNGQLEPKEIPEPLQQPLERFTRLADRDRDGNLSRREFLDGVERMARFMGRRQPDAMPERDAEKERDSKPSKGK